MASAAKNMDTQLRNSASNTTSAASSWLIIQATSLQVPENLLWFIPLALFIPRLLRKQGINIPDINLGFLSPRSFKEPRRRKYDNEEVLIREYKGDG